MRNIEKSSKGNQDTNPLSATKEYHVVSASNSQIYHPRLGRSSPWPNVPLSPAKTSPDLSVVATATTIHSCLPMSVLVLPTSTTNKKCSTVRHSMSHIQR